MSRAILSSEIRRQLDDLQIDEVHGRLTDPPHARLLLLRDGSSIADALYDDKLDDADVRYLERCHGGVIVMQLQDGTGSVRYFDDEDAIEDRWSDLCSDLDGGAAPALLCVKDESDPERDADPGDDDEDDAAWWRSSSSQAKPRRRTGV